MNDFNAQEIRQSLISTRKSLSAASIQKSAEILARYVEIFHCYKEARTIAIYLAINGEADPSEIKHNAWLDGKAVYLPVINNGCLSFSPYTANSILVPGQFNIPVPEHSPNDLLSPNALDVVIMPLVAFDSNLNRIGMGGGYYDKTFSFRQNNTKKPRLIGIAHDLQRVEPIEPQPWDIPMDMVVTEKAVYCKPETI